MDSAKTGCDNGFGGGEVVAGGQELRGPRCRWAAHVNAESSWEEKSEADAQIFNNQGGGQ